MLPDGGSGRGSPRQAVTSLKSPLFRRLLLTAFVLIAATTFAVDHTLLRSGVEPAVRWNVFTIALSSAVFALVIAYGVSRSLANRVSRLKRFAVGLVEVRPTESSPDDSHDELGALEHTLTRVAAEIGKLLDRLRFESARREAILSSMGEGVLAVDSELRVTFCNQAFLRAVGSRRVMPAEPITLLELVRDPGLRAILGDVVKTGLPRKERLKVSAANGRTFEVQAAPLAMPNGQGAIAILHDMTDAERLEQVRKDFVANVSHEFRTPLAGVIGYAETLLDGALEDKDCNRKFVEIIRTNAIRLNNIASDLLILSELESGVAPPETESIGVRDVIEGVLLTVNSEAGVRMVELIEEDVEDVFVTGSRLRLEQALLNLVANAIKFNRPSGKVRIRANRTQDGQVLISISDTGVGIPSEDVPRIFERFYRVDKARSRQVGGTGLGLSIVKHVVERMNGSVSVESQLGSGSTFTVRLPVLPTSDECNSTVMPASSDGNHLGVS
jgi:two-component system, OmpR family, phosphate regulon sensor histidine kinase PhoR